jgi:hypothetical protein
MIATSTTLLTYGTCLPRDGYHQLHCGADLGDACQCSVWWRGREYSAQWLERGYTRIDHGPPYTGGELPPPAAPPLEPEFSLTPIYADETRAVVMNTALVTTRAWAEEIAAEVLP